MTVADRLEDTKARPRIVEGAVRCALREAVAWRIGGGAPPHAEAFVAAAVATARLQLDAGGDEAARRSLTLTAVQRAAKRFAESKLCRRLMTMPASQFARLPSDMHGADIILRDRRGRLHAIVLRACGDGLDAGRIATTVAAATQLPIAQRLLPLTVHVYCLRRGTRQTFNRELTSVRRIA